MLTMTPSDGLMTIRASARADHPEIERRAIAALDDGRDVVVLATGPGAEGLAFYVKRVGRDFMVAHALASATVEVDEAHLDAVVTSYRSALLGTLTAAGDAQEARWRGVS